MYSSKMVFKYRINVAGMLPINTLLEVYPLGSQTIMLHEFSIGAIDPVRMSPFLSILTLF